MANIQTVDYKFCFAILAFGRSDGLQRIVFEILRYFPSVQIIVLVDKYEGSDCTIRQANNNTIKVAESLLSQGLITYLKIPKTNLRTKQAWKEMMKISFGYSDSVVYVEDDLTFVDNPTSYLNWALNIINSSPSIAFATLFTSRKHESKGKAGGRLTNWPESWGVLIEKQKFEKLQETIDDIQTNGIRILSVFIFPIKSIFVRTLSKRFIKVWIYKFRRALEIDTAWDTELHLAIWVLGMQVLAPSDNLLIDTGVHFTSVSMHKKPLRISSCRKVLSSDQDRYSTDPKILFCNLCEKKMEKKGYIFLPHTFRGLFISMESSLERFGMLLIKYIDQLHFMRER